MYAKTTTLFTTTILWLVFYGLSTSPVLAKLSPGSSQGIPSNADTEVGLSETETLKALKKGTDISQVDNLPAPSTPEPSTPIPPETTPEPPAQTVTPAPTPAQAETTASPNQSNVPGIVNSLSADGTTVEMKLADGTFKSFQLSRDLVNSSKSNIVQGDFVNLRVDKDQIVREVQQAEVESTLEGIVRAVDGNVVTLQLRDGSLTTTTVAPAVSARMGLVAGTPLKVTSYRGIGSTKLCFGETNPPPLPPPPVIQQPPITPPPRVVPRPTPPRPRPPRIRALW